MIGGLKMTVLNKGSSDGRKKISVKKAIILSSVFTVYILLSAFAEITFLSAFDKTPSMTLALICAVGFVCGERFGAIFGIVGGILIDCLGGSPMPLSPILYMLCGYMCGVAVGWFLSSNFPSFIVYSVIVGILKEIFSFVSVALLSDSFNFWNVITKLLIPELLAYILCAPPAYFAVWGINRLFKGKDNRVKHS
jgi:rod shape-determining protein MreD